MNPSTLLARLAVEALRVGGVRHVVLCPGSRSAPLAYALGASDAVDLHVRHDERVAAFTAMGAAGAVVTTSGTAAANLHPAVLEAHHGRRPLVVVTADRPRELRGTWANQTSELQAELYGRAVRAALDLADVDAAKDPDAALRALVDVVAAARRLRGPVHLDLGFTEPLLPDDEAGELQLTVQPRTAEVQTASGIVEPGPRTVVVAGDGADAGLGAQARDVALAAGWPLLAEPSSGAAGPDAVAAYRLLLELPELGGAVERAVVYGRPTLSRPVTRLLNRSDVELVLVAAGHDRPDPGRPARRVAPLDLAALPPAGEDRGWARRWALASFAARGGLDAVLDDLLTEHPELPAGPLVARAVALAARPGDTLVVAASNPVRDLDLVVHRIPRGLRVLSNRGLAGIDGTVSTASGAAFGGAFVRVLVGDLAFLHDANALLVPPGEERPHLQVVVLNDDGGGIFSLLEQGELATQGAAEGAAFERLFGTPHGVDVAALCAAYGVPHRLVDGVPDLADALESPPPGTSVVELRTTRDGLREVHARIRAAVHDAVHGALADL
ncbi:MAG TPA: 2-succinyl-5-enolpyruvyl-6-hydroxy-3-cyclohexene-1-carboxylic-acid synthase [Kineosporiaceae bacterium]|nr:2-succinyl-5-enolpyruvyl-6-hydroxy-3-cyclohexene-1-carboxylic-acid synthase [Kineosporiaceae bacterium]